MKNKLKLFGIASIAMAAPLFFNGAVIAQPSGSGVSITTPRVVIPNNRIIPHCHENNVVCHWQPRLEIPELPECDPRFCDPSPIDPRIIRELEQSPRFDQIQQIEPMQIEPMQIGHIQRVRNITPAERFLKMDE